MSRRHLVVEADGGSRGNPGVAGYGALVRDGESGALLAERAEPLGLASNNVAEYSGLIAGLQAVLSIDPSARVAVRMDSKLVVEQMAGRWKIKHEDMRRLALQARELVRSIVAAGGQVDYTWIPRAENAAADALSNVAMDGESVDRTFGGESALEDLPSADSTSVDGPTDVGKGDTDDTEFTESRDSESESAFEAEPEAAPAARRGPGRGAVTRIVLVRHGVTRFTEEGRLDGRGGADPSLSTTGRSQAAAAGRACAHLLGGHDARVITSSLARAVETGAAIAEQIGVAARMVEAFDEQAFGDWDGAAIRDLLHDPEHGFERMRRDPAYSRPGGESRIDLAARVLPAWQDVVAHGGTTILVCHRIVILVLLGHLLGLDDDMAWRLAIAPGSLTAVEIWENGEIQLAFVNRT